MNEVVKYSDINKEIFDLLNSHLVKEIKIDYCWEHIFYSKIHLTLQDNEKYQIITTKDSEEYIFTLSTTREKIQLLSFLLFAMQDGIRIIGTCARGKFCENSTLLTQIIADVLPMYDLGKNNNIIKKQERIEEFEAKYGQQGYDNNSTSASKTECHSQKLSSFSLCDFVIQIVPRHIRYYIKQLEQYGFRLSSLHVSGFIKMIARDQRVSVFIHFADKQCFRFDFYEDREYYYVDNHDWDGAFNELVASFPDDIKENYK